MDSKFLKGIFVICGAIGFFTPIIWMKNKGIGIIVGTLCSSVGLIGVYCVHKYEHEYHKEENELDDD